MSLFLFFYYISYKLVASHLAYSSFTPRDDMFNPPTPIYKENSIKPCLKSILTYTHTYHFIKNNKNIWNVLGDKINKIGK